jgi:hypothetical protein
MYCPHCGSALAEGERFCTSCGVERRPREESAPIYASKRRVGFSPRISDQAFVKYVGNSNRWAFLFSAIMAAAAVIGFYIAGEAGVEDMSNPESLYIGFGIGGMFLAIALFQVLGRKRSTTWDGTVEDKKVEKKTRQRDDGSGYVSSEDYLKYTVIVRADSGKLHEITAGNDDTMYNYYRVGDRVRHHAGLSYEKYDKTGDEFVPCVACASLNDIDDDVCFRCKCPLLK